MIAPWKDDVIKFAQSQLNKFQPHEDYCELLELSIIFWGGTPERGIRFRYLVLFTGLVGWRGPFIL